MRIERLLAGLALGVLLSAPLSAQNPSQTFRTAYDAFSRGNYAQSLALLTQVERSVGRNPRVESLRVHVYFSQRDFVNAAIALNRYRRLAPNASGPAHQQLLAMGPHIEEGVRQMEFTWQDSVQSRRNAEADRAIAATYPAAERQRTEAVMREAGARRERLQSEFDAYQRMMNSGDVESAQRFVQEFPNSVHRDTAVVLWRTRYLSSASTYTGEQGVQRMRQFRPTFDRFGVPRDVQTQANAIYARHVAQAQTSLRQQYADNAASAARRERKAWTSTLITAGLVGVAVTLVDTEGAGYGPIAGLGALGLSMAIDQPWTAGRYARSRNQDIARRLADLDRYPRLY